MTTPCRDCAFYIGGESGACWAQALPDPGGSGRMIPALAFAREGEKPGCPECEDFQRRERHGWPLALCLEWVSDCLLWRGEVLHGERIHWCADWDGLPVDETSDEWEHGCHCFERGGET